MWVSMFFFLLFLLSSFLSVFLFFFFLLLFIFLIRLCFIQVTLPQLIQSKKRIRSIYKIIHFASWWCLDGNHRVRGSQVRVYGLLFSLSLSLLCYFVLFYSFIFFIFFHSFFLSYLWQESHVGARGCVPFSRVKRAVGLRFHRTIVTRRVDPTKGRKRDQNPMRTDASSKPRHLALHAVHRSCRPRSCRTTDQRNVE